MSLPEPRTYFWDFFGPRSGPTAAHFKRHLQGFLDQHGIGELALSEVSLSPGHHAIGVTTPPEHVELIEKALRPRRSSP
ncbi:MAG TPA: hypothetical protein VEQ58_12045 [Polyangiaceae bacterium]|nr:hypothetical protein [Polyangiaceae bacterium]